MHNVIESEYSVYTNRLPGAFTAGIMIRKIQLLLTSHMLSPCYKILFLQHVYFWIMQCYLK